MLTYSDMLHSLAHHQNRALSCSIYGGNFHSKEMYSVFIVTVMPAMVISEEASKEHGQCEVV